MPKKTHNKTNLNRTGSKTSVPNFSRGGQQVTSRECLSPSILLWTCYFLRMNSSTKWQNYLEPSFFVLVSFLLRYVDLWIMFGTTHPSRKTLYISNHNPQGPQFWSFPQLWAHWLAVSITQTFPKQLLCQSVTYLWPVWNFPCVACRVDNIACYTIKDEEVDLEREK